MVNAKFEKLTAKERGNLLQNKRKELHMSQSDLASCILDGLQSGRFSEFNFSEEEFGKLMSLAKEVNADKKKLSEWETGRIKTVNENYLKLWKSVLNLDSSCEFEKVKLPVITKEEFENPYVQCVVEFLEYVLTMKKENKLEEYLEYEFRYRMGDMLGDFLATNKNSSRL